MSEQTAYERVYAAGKDAGKALERQRIEDAIKELSTYNEDLTQKIVYLVDLEEVINEQD